MTTSLAGQTVVVMGATGQQGGATARHLLAEGYSVRAVVRDPRSPGSQGLANIGVELVVGDMDDRESLRAAMRGAYGIFSVQPALIPPTFAENELQRGLNVADAAHEAGIAHVVYSSVAGANRRTGIPFTMLRPTLFMDMHADATYGVTGELSLVRSLPSNANVQHIAIADVAAFTALALANPSHYLGKALELAGDELTVDQVLTAIGRASGRSDLRRWTKEVSTGRGSAGRLIRYAGWQADIPSLRALHPGLMTFETWLARGGAALIDRRRWIETAETPDLRGLEPSAREE